MSEYISDKLNGKVLTKDKATRKIAETFLKNTFPQSPYKGTNKLIDKIKITEIREIPFAYISMDILYERRSIRCGSRPTNKITPGAKPVKLDDYYRRIWAIDFPYDDTKFETSEVASGWFRDSYVGIPCPTCKGVQKKGCTNCNNRGRIRCPYCYGEGKTKCTICGGSGTGNCTYCWGSGYRNEYDFYYDTYVDKKCPYCDGTGYKYCSCNHGYKTCIRCDGSGTIMCGSCKGSGNAICKTCEGQGGIETGIVIEQQMDVYTSSKIVYEQRPDSEFYKEYKYTSWNPHQADEHLFSLLYSEQPKFFEHPNFGPVKLSVEDFVQHALQVINAEGNVKPHKYRCNLFKRNRLEIIFTIDGVEYRAFKDPTKTEMYLSEIPYTTRINELKEQRKNEKNQRKIKLIDDELVYIINESTRLKSVRKNY